MSRLDTLANGMQEPLYRSAKYMTTNGCLRLVLFCAYIDVGEGCTVGVNLFFGWNVPVLFLLISQLTDQSKQVID